MYVDIGPALADVATPGVSRSALERLDARVGRAHERIERGMAEETFGYAALNLPFTTDVPAIRRACDRFDDVGAVLVAGIGGSALGAATLVEAVGGDVPVHVLDNVDPARLGPILEAVDLDRTVLVVVSRSGRTMETLAVATAVREAMTAAGVDWTTRTMVTTGDEGPLRAWATTHDLAALPVPKGVPGRYAALSTVALPIAALAGQDIAAYLEGAKSGRERLAGSLFETPAYAYGAVAYALAARGCDVNVMMPYAEALETYAEWFAQLWAESLGKDGLGQVPVRALGATDQHSQLQLYRAGPRTAMVTVLRPRARPSLTIQDPPEEVLSGVDLGDLLDAEYEATAASLTQAERPSVRLEIDRIDERAIGGLLFAMEAACILMADLLSIDPFDQPAVEWGKRETRRLLEAGAPAATATGRRPSLVIE